MSEFTGMHHHVAQLGFSDGAVVPCEATASALDIYKNHNEKNSKSYFFKTLYNS